jgi:hypothetical protein
MVDEAIGFYSNSNACFPNTGVSRPRRSVTRAAKMAELGAAGRDPSEGGKNAEIRAAKLKERWAAQREWDA